MLLLLLLDCSIKSTFARCKSQRHALLTRSQVSVAAVASLSSSIPKAHPPCTLQQNNTTTLFSSPTCDFLTPLSQILVCIGVGTDRANGVSDAATLRAVAELTAASAFYGCVSLDAATGALYRKCIQVRK
jgi:hypothetical protein